MNTKHLNQYLTYSSPRYIIFSLCKHYLHLISTVYYITILTLSNSLFSLVLLIVSFFCFVLFTYLVFSVLIASLDPDSDSCVNFSSVHSHPLDILDWLLFQILRFLNLLFSSFLFHFLILMNAFFPRRLFER